MKLGWNEIGWLMVGTAVGFVAGIAIYWLPLGQFSNEIQALWNLKRRYRTGDEVTVKAGTDLYPVDTKLRTVTISANKKMKVAHDEGVGWHHTHSGWKRARILHVYDPDQNNIPDLYRTCHWQLV